MSGVFPEAINWVSAVEGMPLDAAWRGPSTGSSLELDVGNSMGGMSQNVSTTSPFLGLGTGGLGGLPALRCRMSASSDDSDRIGAVVLSSDEATADTPDGAVDAKESAAFDAFTNVGSSFLWEDSPVVSDTDLPLLFGLFDGIGKAQIHVDIGMAAITHRQTVPLIRALHIF